MTPQEALKRLRSHRSQIHHTGPQETADELSDVIDALEEAVQRAGTEQSLAAYVARIGEALGGSEEDDLVELAAVRMRELTHYEREAFHAKAVIDEVHGLVGKAHNRLSRVLTESEKSVTAPTVWVQACPGDTPPVTARRAVEVKRLAPGFKVWMRHGSTLLAVNANDDAQDLCDRYVRENP